MYIQRENSYITSIIIRKEQTRAKTINWREQCIYRVHLGPYKTGARCTHIQWRGRRKNTVAAMTTRMLLQTPASNLEMTSRTQQHIAAATTAISFVTQTQRLNSITFIPLQISLGFLLYYTHPMTMHHHFLKRLRNFTDSFGTSWG